MKPWNWAIPYLYPYEIDEKYHEVSIRELCDKFSFRVIKTFPTHGLHNPADDPLIALVCENWADKFVDSVRRPPRILLLLINIAFIAGLTGRIFNNSILTGIALVALLMVWAMIVLPCFGVFCFLISRRR